MDSCVKMLDVQCIPKAFQVATRRQAPCVSTVDKHRYGGRAGDRINDHHVSLSEKVVALEKLKESTL